MGRPNSFLSWACPFRALILILRHHNVTRLRSIATEPHIARRPRALLLKRAKSILAKLANNGGLDRVKRHQIVLQIVVLLAILGVA